MWRLFALAPRLDPKTVYTATDADADIDGTKVGLVPGSVSGATGYRRELTGQGRLALRLGTIAVLGGIAAALHHAADEGYSAVLTCGVDAPDLPENIVATLNYLPHDNEVEIVLAKAKHYRTNEGRDIVNKMVRVADLTRNAFMNGDISTVMSPRTVITWAQNAEIFGGDIALGFRMTFLNKCDELERGTVAEFFQRAFGQDLPESTARVRSQPSKRTSRRTASRRASTAPHMRPRWSVRRARRCAPSIRSGCSGRRTPAASSPSPWTGCIRTTSAPYWTRARWRSAPATTAPSR